MKLGHYNVHIFKYAHLNKISQIINIAVYLNVFLCIIYIKGGGDAVVF